MNDQYHYYVSAVDGSRYTLLAGPFATHEEALDRVDAAREKSTEIDPRAWFYAYGTCRVIGYSAPGRLNQDLGIVASLSW
jgi:hypothetical protein